MDRDVAAGAVEDAERVVIAAVLLLLQAGVSAVTALGYWVYLASVHVAPHGAQVLPLLMPLVWLTLGLGVARRSLWARRVALGGESAAILVGVLAHLLPGSTLSLVTLLTAIALPSAVVGLLASVARRAFGRNAAGEAGYTMPVKADEQPSEETAWQSGRELAPPFASAATQVAPGLANPPSVVSL